MSTPRITLLTDFGTADGYVAALKGVLAALLPEARVDDATHDIPAGDIVAAAWALGAYWQRYPAGTVHVVVVDPGVGSARRALAVLADERLLIAPDNGVLSYVLRDATAVTCVAIDDARVTHAPIAPTFHGRDVFAPAAAVLAAGADIQTLGEVVTDPVLLNVSAATTAAGEVVHVDRFGNLITNIPAALAAQLHAEAGGVLAAVSANIHFPLRRTYADAGSGDALALVGSRNTVELSVRDGSAAERYGLGRGSRVTLRPGT